MLPLLSLATSMSYSSFVVRWCVATLWFLTNQRPRNYHTQKHRQRIDILSGPALRAVPAKTLFYAYSYESPFKYHAGIFGGGGLRLSIFCLFWGEGWGVQNLGKDDYIILECSLTSLPVYCLNGDWLHRWPFVQKWRRNETQFNLNLYWPSKIVAAKLYWV